MNKLTETLDPNDLGKYAKFMRVHGKALEDRWHTLNKRPYKKGTPYEGIEIYSKWLRSNTQNFKNFSIWAFNTNFHPSKEISRIGDTGGYFPNNCRWLPKKDNRSESGNVIEIVDLVTGITSIQRGVKNTWEQLLALTLLQGFETEGFPKNIHGLNGNLASEGSKPYLNRFVIRTI